MTWGFQLVVAVQRGRIIGPRDQLWNLSPPIQELTVTTDDENLQSSTELIFRGGGYDANEAAIGAGHVLVTCLRRAGVILGLGLDFGDDQPRSFLTDYAREQMEAQLEATDSFLVPDVRGLVAYEEIRHHPLRVAIHGDLTIG